MLDLHDEDEWPDPGRPEVVNPRSDRLVFREDPLALAKVAAARPFDQGLSDIQPIRLVRTESGHLLIMEGNHRVYAARLDDLTSIIARVCTLDEWEAAFGPISRRRGSNNPGLQP